MDSSPSVRVPDSSAQKAGQLVRHPAPLTWQASPLARRPMSKLDPQYFELDSATERPGPSAIRECAADHAPAQTAAL